MPRKAKRYVVHARVERELYDIILQRAKDEERSVTAVVERALRDYFQQGGSQ